MALALLICVRMLIVYQPVLWFRLHAIVAILAVDAAAGEHRSALRCSAFVVLTNLLDSSL